MKINKRIILAILIMLAILGFIGNGVYASSIINTIKPIEYSKEFLEYLKLSDEEKNKVLMPSPYTLAKSKTIMKNPLQLGKMLGSGLESRFSLKSVIPNNVVVRNQKNTQECWAFSSLSSLETNLALANGDSKVYDFSERHMDYTTSQSFIGNTNNPSGFNRKVGSGGNWFIASSYLTNGTGAVLESAMPFENNENDIYISEIQNKKVASQIYDTIKFPAYEATDDLTEIMQQMKQHIKNYGSIMASIYGASFINNNYYNNDTGALYCDNKDDCKVNHGVSIIGWDDNYAVENFKEGHRPSNKGAWIIRNSWGTKYEEDVDETREALYQALLSVYTQEELSQQGITDYSKIPDDMIVSFFEKMGYNVTIENGKISINVGDNGLMYLSYEDVNVYSALWGITKSSDTVDYENLYQYNNFEVCNYYVSRNSKIYLGNIFNKKTNGKEYLTQVALDVGETNTCKVYVNTTGASMKQNDLIKVQLKAGESETIGAGYHTLEFLEPVEITGNQFTVVIEATSARNDGNTYAVEYPLENTVASNVTVESEKCFISFDGNFEQNDWVDLSKMSQISSSFVNADSTIKAFTVSQVVDHSLNRIQVTTPPTKTTYFVGENFDKSGMVVTAYYNDNTSKVITDYNITGGNSLQKSTTAVTISYEGKTTTQNITVQENTVEKIQVTTPPTKTAYYVGENFNKAGMVVTATYKNGTSQAVTDYEITNGTDLKENQTTVTISFEGKTTTQNITVTKNSEGENQNPPAPETKTVSSIAVSKMPTKTTYIQNKETLDLTGGTIKVTYSDGTEEEIPMKTGSVSTTGFTNEKIGTVSVTLIYEGKTAQIELQVIEEPKAVSSDFTNATGSVNGIAAYTFSDATKEGYVLVKVSAENINVNNNNDSTKYYYYLSANQKESDIKDWIEIEGKVENGKLMFEIDSRKLKNYHELSSSNTLYLYLKEIAIKGSDQAVTISSGLEITSNSKVETYLDGRKVDVAQIDTATNTGNSTNTKNEQDNTTANGKIPQTGATAGVVIVMIAIVSFAIIAYIRYKKINNYIK